MKIPTDEEIDEVAGANAPVNFGGQQYAVVFAWAQGQKQMRDQLKPLLSLVEQLREARKDYENKKANYVNPTKEDTDLRIAYVMARQRVEELRDQLELGE